jgi:hypothetical protein
MSCGQFRIRGAEAYKRIDSLGQETFLGIFQMVMPVGRYERGVKVGQFSFYCPEEVLWMQSIHTRQTQSGLWQAISVLTLKVSSMLSIPVRVPSVRSILALHVCIMKASRNCLADQVFKASCTRQDEGTQSRFNANASVCITYLYRDEVLQRFAHFQSLNMKMARV